MIQNELALIVTMTKAALKHIFDYILRYKNNQFFEL